MGRNGDDGEADADKGPKKTKGCCSCLGGKASGKTMPIEPKLRRNSIKQSSVISTIKKQQTKQNVTSPVAA